MIESVSHRVIEQLNRVIGRSGHRAIEKKKQPTEAFNLQFLNHPVARSPDDSIHLLSQPRLLHERHHPFAEKLDLLVVIEPTEDHAFDTDLGHLH